MTYIRFMGLNLAKFVNDLVKPTFPRSFSITGLRRLSVGSPTRAKKVAPWAQRLRGGAVDHVKYHPIINEIKDEEKLRAFPRCSVDFSGYELPVFRRFKSMPGYRPSIESERKVKEEDIKLALQGRDAYEASDYLSRANFKDTSLSISFLKSIYADAWTSSANKKPPTDLKQVLRAIPPWIEIGVKPGNLFSEAIRLLSGNPSWETLILCTYYRGLGRGIALPQDDIIFPILEDRLLAEGSSLTMPELEVICSGFSESRTGFSQEKYEQLNKVVEKRFFKLLPTYRWNEGAHCVLKHLLYNRHYDLCEMPALQPALEDSGFFKYCLKRPRAGVRDLGILTGFLASRKFKDGPLLRKCVDTLKIVTDEGNSRSAKIEDVALILKFCANLGVKLDDDVVRFALSHFRGDVKSVNGKDLLLSLEALAMNAVFPRDLINALFSSQKFMRVEGGRMPGMNESRMKDPSIELYRLDARVELACPDYAGARLPAEVRKLALDRLRTRAYSEEELRKSSPEIYRLADALNKEFNELSKTKNEKFVSIARPEPSTLMAFIIIELDEKNKPISLEKSAPKVGKPSSRKIAVYLLVENHFLTHYDGVHVTEFAEIQPIYRRNFTMIERRGYEVEAVPFTDPLLRSSNEHFDRVVRNLVSRLCKPKSLK